MIRRIFIAVCLIYAICGSVAAQRTNHKDPATGVHYAALENAATPQAALALCLQHIHAQGGGECDASGIDSDYSISTNIFSGITAPVQFRGSSKAAVSVTENLTVPANVAFRPNGVWSPITGKTLTISDASKIENPGNVQIFGGAGSISFGSSGRTITPEWFGAAGDGTTDDTAAIAAAISALGSGSGIVNLTCGKTYLATNVDLTDKANITIDGCASASRYSKFSPTTTAPATLLYAGAGAAFVTMDSATGITLRHLRIIYNNAGFTGTLIRQGHSASAADPGHNAFEDCHFSGTASAKSANPILDLAYNGAGPTIINRCEFLYFQNGIRGLVEAAVPYSNIVQITNSEFANYNAPGGCSIVNPGDGWTISGNAFEQGTDGHGCALVSPTTGSALSYTKGLLYTGNWHGDPTILGPGAIVGVYGSGLIAGNHFESTGGVANAITACPWALDISGNTFGHPSAGIANAIVFTATCTSGTASLNGNDFTSASVPVTNAGSLANFSALGNKNFANTISAHVHAGGDITSGTVADAYLPATLGGKTFTGDVEVQSGGGKIELDTYNVDGGGLRVRGSTATNAPYGYALLQGLASTPYWDIQAGDDVGYRAIVLNRFGGPVGVGTSDPQARFEVADGGGRIQFDTYNVDGGGFRVVGSTAANAPYGNILLQGLATTPYLDIQAGDSSAYRNIVLNGAGGNVGIGGAPTQKVDVFGAIGISGTEILSAARVLHNVTADAGIITGGALVLARGGTGVDLSATGAATHVLAQDAAHLISARALIAADIPPLRSAILSGFCGGAFPGGTTVYMPAWGGASSVSYCTLTSEIGGPRATHSFTAKNLYVNVGTAGCCAGSGIVTLRVNNVNSALTCTVGTSTTCADGSHSIAIAAGDLLTISVATASPETLANMNVALEIW